MRENRFLQELAKCHKNIKATTITSDNKYIVSAADDCSIKIWKDQAHGLRKIAPTIKTETNEEKENK